MKRTASLILSSTLLIAGLAAAPAQAQQLTCDDIDLTGPIVERFPRAKTACLAVVERDGRQFAKFSAEIQRVIGNTVYAKFNLPDGSKTDTYSFDMPSTARVTVEGRQYRYRDLMPKSDISVYLPEGQWEVHVPHSDDFSTATAATVAVATPTRSEEPDDMVAMLPKTASPLPLIGMLGGLLTSLGLLLYGVRRRLVKA